MADKQIPTLTAASTLTGTEQVHCVQGGNSRRTTTQDIANLASSQAAFSKLTATGTTSLPNNTVTEVVFATEAVAGAFRSSTPPSNGFKIPTGVTYVRFSWMATISAVNAATSAGFRVVDGSGNLINLHQHYVSNTGTTYHSASTGPIPVSAGDTFTLKGFQNGGGTEDMNGGFGTGASDYARCFFAIEDVTP